MHTASDGLAIDRVEQGTNIIRVFASAGRTRLEYTKLSGQAWEVYDFPRSWNGLSRFVGYLPAETGIKLDGILARRARENYAAKFAA